MYETQIEKTINELICGQFSLTPEYQALRSQLLTTAGMTVADIDAFLQSLVAKGVNIDSALICLSELLKTKI